MAFGAIAVLHTFSPPQGPSAAGAQVAVIATGKHMYMNAYHCRVEDVVSETSEDHFAKHDREDHTNDQDMPRYGWRHDECVYDA